MALPATFVVNSALAWWYWDPPREIFYVPWLGRPVLWYGFFFVLGFILGYWMFIPLLLAQLQNHAATRTTTRAQCHALADRLMWYLIIGSLVGARLGHVFFYDWPTYHHRWLDVFKIWEGGLASHGGAVGILIALGLFRWSITKQYPTLTFLTLLDLICIPTALAACFIRLGNLVNQEILGIPTTVPWAVVFGHAADGSAPLPRHPVQLYEAMAYFAIFCLLLACWRYFRQQLPQGALSGLFILLMFGARFMLECYKAPQSLLITENYWMMGQYLSLPFMALGAGLLVYAYFIRPWLWQQP